VQKFPMTAEGLSRLEQELRQLKGEERPAVIRAIAEARAHGDLSENAEYHAAREQQGFIEGRIQDLEGKLGNAEIIDVTAIANNGKVIFGSTVDLEDEDSGTRVTYQIVGEDEADIKISRISFGSPIARALVGKSEGDAVEVVTPGGKRNYEIIAVRYV